MPQVLDVFLYGQPVGQITDLGGDRNLFVFHEAYLEDSGRPLLSLGFKGVHGGVAYKAQVRQTRVDPFFSNLLPEGKLRDYVADRDGVHRDREFQLLRLLGQDLPGAVEVRLADGETADENAPPADSEVGADAPLKFSLAGVQMKLSAVKEATGGLTIPANGKGGRWIVKFPSETFEAVPQNEFWMMTFARRVGLTTPDIELVGVRDIGGMPPGIRSDLGPALAVRRFDRTPDGRRVHMEDFAQVFRIYPREKYARANFEQIADVLWREAGEAGLTEFVARLVFTAAIGNGDMHVKNWSVLHPFGKPPQLAPVYDYVSTLTYMDGENLGLNLAGSKAFEDVSEASFETLAKRINAPIALVLEAATAAASRIHDEWASVRREADLPKAILEAIDAQMARVPILAASRPPPRPPSPLRALADTHAPGPVRARELGDIFERSLPEDVFRPAASLTGTFVFVLDSAEPLGGEAEAWSGRLQLERIRNVRSELRALALSASAPEAMDVVARDPPFRPRRGPNVSLTRLPLATQPMIAELGGRGVGGDDHWWLLALGAGAILRRYPTDITADGPILELGNVIADVGGVLAFVDRFAGGFPGSEKVSLEIRWRGLKGLRVEGGRKATAGEVRTGLVVSLTELARSKRSETVAKLASDLLQVFALPSDREATDALIGKAVDKLQRED